MISISVERGIFQNSSRGWWCGQLTWASLWSSTAQALHGANWGKPGIDSKLFTLPLPFIQTYFYTVIFQHMLLWEQLLLYKWGGNMIGSTHLLEAIKIWKHFTCHIWVQCALCVVTGWEAFRGMACDILKPSCSWKCNALKFCSGWSNSVHGEMLVRVLLPSCLIVLFFHKGVHSMVASSPPVGVGGPRQRMFKAERSLLL